MMRQRFQARQHVIEQSPVSAIVPLVKRKAVIGFTVGGLPTDSPEQFAHSQPALLLARNHAGKERRRMLVAQEIPGSAEADHRIILAEWIVIDRQ